MDTNTAIKLEIAELKKERESLALFPSEIDDEISTRQVELDRRAAENQMSVYREPDDLPKPGDMFLGGFNGAVVYIVKDVIRTAQGIERKFFNEHIDYVRINSRGRRTRGRQSFEKFLSLVEKGL